MKPAAADAELAKVRDVVAIDGPSGAGKSTVARQLASRLGFAYLDTGAMYRAVTWHFLENQLVDLTGGTADRSPRLQSVLENLELQIGQDGHLFVNGKDVTAHLRSFEVESRVSTVSALPSVRDKMRHLQRVVASRGPVVADGRDMASVVFPQARWKFYLDAEPEERAWRRLHDFRRAGREVTEAEVLEEIAVRDRLDSTRKDAPLIHTREADYVDTTGLAVEQVVDLLYARVREAGPT